MGIPLISVIVPIYNVELYLDKCVRSIANQTYQNLEIILVDDGSQDRCPHICDMWAKQDARIKVIHKENGGLSSARNAGLEICEGSYVGFIDSDDWIEPLMYEELLNECRNKNNSIVSTGIRYVNENSFVYKERRIFNDVNNSNDLLRNILLHKDGGSVCNRLFSRNLIGNSRFEEGRLNEDVLFMVELMNKVEYISDTSTIGYNYLQRGGSISHHFGKSIKDMIGNSVKIRQHVNKYFPDLYMEAERFEIFQHMNFLLVCPSDYDRKRDDLYKDVVIYIREHWLMGLKNPYFTLKEKLKLLGVTFSPKIMSILVEKNRKFKNI